MLNVVPAATEMLDVPAETLVTDTPSWRLACFA
jgi:hypothetical protein